MKASNKIGDVVRSVAEALAPSELDATGRPKFTFNGLATPPLRPVRTLLGLLSRVEVLPGTWGVCYGGDRGPTVLKPGLHWLTNSRGGSPTVQFVDASRRPYELPPVSGLSADGWRVTLKAVLVYEAASPLEVARAAEPIATLEATARAAILAQIEAHSHQALIGSGVAPLSSSANGGMGLKAIEDGILARLNERPGLAGLRVVEVALVERQGDERLAEIMQAGEVERARLEAEAWTAEAARAAAVIQAETQAQLTSAQEQMKVLAARTEAEVQEIRQAQEAREAERKRLAEEWRTAKELDLRAMEYQHAETLAIIQGTTQITTEAAKTGALGLVRGSARRRPEVGSDEAGAEVVEAGIQVLKAFREKIAPPVTHFLPRPVGSSFDTLRAQDDDRQDRVRAEALRLERLRGAEHELIVRRGQLAGARVWFAPSAPAALAGVRVEFACPDGYPATAPTVKIVRSDTTVGRPVVDWEGGLFLADLVREVMVELATEVVDVGAKNQAGTSSGA